MDPNRDLIWRESGQSVKSEPTVLPYNQWRKNYTFDLRLLTPQSTYLGGVPFRPSAFSNKLLAGDYEMEVIWPAK